MLNGLLNNRRWQRWVLAAAVAAGLACRGEVESRWVAVCLLTYAGKSGDAAGTLEAVHRLESLYGERTPVFGQLRAALTKGTWKEILPAVNREVGQFGATFTYKVGGSPLADLARRLTLDLDSSNADSRRQLAGALADAFPGKPVFRYLADGIKAAKAENGQYANTVVRGQRMADYAAQQLAEIKKQLEEPGTSIKKIQELTEEQQKWRREQAKGRQLVVAGKELRPIGAALADLQKKLFVTIDELEAIGDL